MTIIEKEVTREKPQTKTVHTCDICGIAEVDMPDDEEIVDMKSGKSVDVTYAVQVAEVEGNDRFDKRFDKYEEAKEYVMNLDKKKYTFTKHSMYDVSWDMDIDVCTHCINTLFGQASRPERKNKSKSIYG